MYPCPKLDEMIIKHKMIRLNHKKLNRTTITFAYAIRENIRGFWYRALRGISRTKNNGLT